MNCEYCGSNNYKKNGFFNTELHRVQKYKCKDCGGHFTEDIDKKFEKKPDLDEEILELYRQGLSQRQIAQTLDCARWTVQLKLKKYL